MYLLLWLFFGLFVGAIANAFYPHRQRGAMMSLLSGVAGSYLGGAFSHFILGNAHFAPAGFLASIAGAIVFNIAYVYFIVRKVEEPKK